MHIARMALVLGLAVVASPEDLAAQTSEPSREERLSEVFSYYLKEGGIWRQDNRDFEAGSGLPVAYVKRYEWGPGRSIVLDDTFALMEDGTCKQWTHNIFHWDTKENLVRGQIFHFSGASFSGVVRRDGDHKTTAEFTGTLPNGADFRMRDSTDLSDPHVARITASIADGDAWNEAPPASWTQVMTGKKPCGF